MNMSEIRKKYWIPPTIQTEDPNDPRVLAIIDEIETRRKEVRAYFQQKREESDAKERERQRQKELEKEERQKNYRRKMAENQEKERQQKEAKRKKLLGNIHTYRTRPRKYIPGQKAYF